MSSFFLAAEQAIRCKVAEKLTIVNRIPYEKALEFANKEKITDMLYPLFVHNVSAMMLSSTSQHGDHARSLDPSRGRPRGRDTPMGLLQAQVPSQSGPNSLSAISQAANDRPVMERSQTFPTPPASASSLIASQPNNYDWNRQNMASNVQTSQPLAIDTSLSNGRSLPNTPASTPPGSSIQSMQTYQNNQYPIQQGNSRYGPSNPYIKNEMGPPPKSATGESDQIEIKQDPYVHNNAEAGETSEGDGYARGGYMNYSGMVENSITSPDQVNGSPHQSRRSTPRSSIHSQQWTTGYNTPNRNSTTYSDTPVSASYPGNNYTPTSLGGVKRGREDDECDYKPPRPNINDDIDSIKRRRATTDSNISSISGYDSNRLQNGNGITSRTR